MLRLSILIPYYNEPTLQRVLDGLYALVFDEGMHAELIAIDDGSTDETTAILKRDLSKYPGLILLEHQKNQGKGAALKTGIQHSTGDIIIVQDADLEYRIEDIPKVVKPIAEKRTLVCYGSRHLDTEQRRQNLIWFRKHFQHSLFAALGGRFITWTVNVLFGVRLTDALTGYKAFDAAFLKKISLRSNGFDMEAELTAKVLRKTKIMEVPIHYYPRTRQEGKKIRLSDGMRSLNRLFYYRFGKSS